MTGRLAALALLAMLAPAATRAAPFDTYELVMWQEHTPRELDGLKQLGFTGTKLRATGGVVDPAELAAHIASGLPWFLENVATDLYSPYHRYTPGKPVTWLWDELKVRRRADPGDRSVFRREPSLSDPAWLARVSARLKDLVQRQSRFHPLYYNLADEAGIGDLAAAWDADIGPDSLASMRGWLRTQYPSLLALNAEWGTQFERWDDVTPELTDQALRRTDDNYAAWADFKAWMDVAFARALRAGTDALHEADQDALAGLEGAQVPGWGGYDYSVLAPSVDLMEIYDAGNSMELAQAFNPHLITLRTSFGAGDAAEIWRHLLQGGRGTIVWDEDSVINPDGSPKPRGQELGATIAAIRQVAPEVIASRPVIDQVAVLVSQASFRTQWLLDRRPGGAAWSDRDAAREYEDNSWRAARRETLQRLAALGIRPRLLSSATLAGGGLADMRVLILPHAIALSDAEVETIRAFAGSGGTVLADTEPGLFDGHSRLRGSAPLSGVARVPEAMLRSGEPPRPGTLDAEAGLLAAAGVLPRAVFRVDGHRASGIEARWFQRGDRELLALQAATPGAGPARVQVELAQPGTVVDLRGGGPARVGQSFTVVSDLTEPTILSVHR